MRLNGHAPGGSYARGAPGAPQNIEILENPRREYLQSRIGGPYKAFLIELSKRGIQLSKRGHALLPTTWNMSTSLYRSSLFSLHKVRREALWSEQDCRRRLRGNRDPPFGIYGISIYLGVSGAPGYDHSGGSP